MTKKIYYYLAIILPLFACVDCAMGVCSLGGCGGGGDESWQESAQAFLNSEDPIIGTMQYQTLDSKSFVAGRINGDSFNRTIDKRPTNDNTNLPNQDSKTNRYPKGEILKSLDTSFGPSLIIDVSNHTSKGDTHLKGAINIPWTRFLWDNGTLKNTSDLASSLGAAGINPADSLVVYSDAFSSGEATFVFLVLKYLGHKNIKTLDGGLVDWINASLPLETKENMIKSAEYTSHMGEGVLADYEYIKSKNPQLVDARSFIDYGKKRIPNSILINPDDLLNDRGLKTSAQLNDTFARLDRNKAVVVYSDDLLRTSLVWYALQIMGFDSRVYTWQDWLGHES
jgi:thiosulfate/3-mercaptopyruvate sulfurtransferase